MCAIGQIQGDPAVVRLARMLQRIRDMRPYVLASGAARAPFRTLDYSEEALPIPLRESTLPIPLRRSTRPTRPEKHLAVGALALSIGIVVAASACIGYSFAHWIAPAVAAQLVQ